jgi:putative FmdB family regulatory protein
MPRYEFTCEACGPFDVWRPVEEASVRLLCPGCLRPARRRFSAPGLARMPSALRAAREREERSAQAPDVVSAPSGRPMPWSSRHAHGPPWTLGH